jgi:hypothetical protein
MQRSAVDSIRQEIAEAQAEGLGRTERRFLAALDAYRREAAIGASAEAGRTVEPRLWELVDALTHYVVQREACGCRDAHCLYELHRVPPEAVARMGVRPPPRSSE